MEENQTDTGSRSSGFMKETPFLLEVVEDIERVIRILRAWNIRIDEAFFLGGRDKGEFLKAFGADIFFDDQPKHCESARWHVATGHVPHGVAND